MNHKLLKRLAQVGSKAQEEQAKRVQEGRLMAQMAVKNDAAWARAGGTWN